VGGQRHAPTELTPGKRPSNQSTGEWVGPGPVWTGVENLTPTGIRFPDRPACSESLYFWVLNPNPSSVLRYWSREGKVKDAVFVESYDVLLLGLLVPEHRGNQLFRNVGNSIDLTSQKIHSSSAYYENLKS